MKSWEFITLNGRAYFRFWSFALKALLGWSDARIEAWTERFQEDLKEEHGMLYHALPGTFVIVDYLEERHPGWREIIQKHPDPDGVMRGISDCINEFIYPELNEGYGWDDAKQRIEDAVRGLGL